MQISKKKWFIIQSGSAPVYSKPTFNSSWLTESIYGESCSIIKRNKDWLNIKCEDGYVGWIHSFYGIQTVKKNSPKFIVAYPNELGLFSGSHPFGAMLNRKFTGTIKLNEPLKINKLNTILKSLIGIPYRWGGKSSLGFDCSGFTQTVLKMFGLEIPRDSKDQFSYLDDYRVSLFDANPGDLHFFSNGKKVNHVGLSIGGPELIHAQGFVKKDSLDHKKKSFNKNLLDIYHSTYSIESKLQQ